MAIRLFTGLRATSPAAAGPRVALALLLGGAAGAALATPGLPLEPNNPVSLGLRGVSENPVQSSVGQVIGQICPPGNVINDVDLQNRCNEIAVGAIVMGNDISGAQDALQAMGNEEDAAVASTQVDQRGGHTDAVGQRLGTVRAGATGSPVVQQQGLGYNWSGGAAGDGNSPWGAFVTGLYTMSDRDTTAREAGFEADEYGVTAGIDYNFNNEVVVGAAFGYKNSDADIDNNGGQLDSDSYTYIGYWSLYPNENWYVDGMVSYTHSDHDQDRNIIYSIAALGGGTTTVNNTAVSDTESEEWAVSLTAGRNYFIGEMVATPYVRFDYADVEIDGFTESMALANAAGSGLALTVDGQDFESVMTTVGARLTQQVSTSLGAMFPEISFEYVHEFKNSNAPITARFVGDPSGTTIIMLTDGPDRNFFNLGAGVTAAFSDSTSGFFRYQGLFGYEDLDLHAFEVGVRLAF